MWTTAGAAEPYAATDLVPVKPTKSRRAQSRGMPGTTSRFVLSSVHQRFILPLLAPADDPTRRVAPNKIAARRDLPSNSAARDWSPISTAAARSWAVDAAEGVCLCFAPLGWELFLNPTLLASPPGRAAYQVRLPKVLVFGGKPGRISRWDVCWPTGVEHEWTRWGLRGDRFRSFVERIERIDEDSKR